MKRKERRCALIAALLLAGFAAIPAAAEPTRWTMRGRALVSDYENRFTTAYFDNRTELDVDQGLGLEVAVELRANQRVGVELSAGRMSFDAALRNIRTVPGPSTNPREFQEIVTFSDEGDFVMEPIALSLLFHVLRDRPLDLYLGPQAAWVRYDIGVEGAQEREAELAYGAKLGAELRLGGSPWSLGLELRRLQTIHESTDRDLYGNLGVNIAALSLAYHTGPPAGR
ncbi:MAG TPA: outer membrane beta-barrel protein [Thermoanaerobaculia bacterium]|nr:outer membrane beta-barrel protein [Thermoanaerobaculia bacterium]